MRRTGNYFNLIKGVCEMSAASILGSDRQKVSRIRNKIGIALGASSVQHCPAASIWGS